MNVHKFFGKSSREALRQVREALGADAVVLSNRAAAGGIEILAVPAQEMEPLTQGAPPPAPPVAKAPQAAEVSAGKAPRLEQSFADAIVREIQGLRGMVEDQLAEMNWGGIMRRDPVRGALTKGLLTAGFSPALTRHLLERAPPDLATDQAMSWAQASLARRLAVIPDENEILERGGVYALMGPTGVGKTTTTAKLAARCVVRHGAQKLALLTTDGYRIGGQEQLRIYGKILGVAVHAVKDADDIRVALQELRHKHMVLIDTVGMSQRDQQVQEQVAMLSSCGAPVKRLLLLNATSHGDTLDDVVLAYRGQGLAGCIVTKLDEAIAAGPVLDVAMRHRLQVYYVANGQRVPEDLHLANAQFLLHRAFKRARMPSAHAPEEAELSALMGRWRDDAEASAMTMAGIGHA